LISTCPLHQILSGKTDISILCENQTGFFNRDGFPITDGHSLIIPKQHIASFFAIAPEQRGDFFSLVGHAKAGLDEKQQPASDCIGINDGEAADQTIVHLHTHTIHRYQETDNAPRSGVRWLVPE
jgi:diadenosine tetraphosphate (Ap4A) HIT family hydrolase